MKITFLGNFNVDYTSETHHVKSLEALGHEVVKLQEGKARGEDVLESALNSDLLVVVHTHGWITPGLALVDVLRNLKGKVQTLTYHLDLWLGIERQKDLESDGFYKLIDWFFCTDKLMADWFCENTDVKGRYIPAGVFHEEAYMIESPVKKHDVVFTGSKGYHPEWPWRPKLIEWLKSTYGDKFEHYGNDGIRIVRGAELNNLYATSKVVIGDTLCKNFEYPYYFSDRLFETTGRGAFVIFPYIKGIEDNFKIGKEIVTFKFGDFDDLKAKIDYYLKHDKAREKIRKAGYERSHRDHTYLQRWNKILEEVTK